MAESVNIIDKINYHSEFNPSNATTSEIFDEATRNFKLVKRAGSKSNKYRGLHYWTYNKSIKLIEEINTPTKNNKTYKRGSIIYVDFGVNIGQEFSGPHFCIVLNKSDHKHNEKLTVVPLTSHQHPYTVRLKNTITETSLAFLKKTYRKLSQLSFSQLILMQQAALVLDGKEPDISYVRSILGASSDFQELLNTTPETYREMLDNLNSIQSFEYARENIKDFIIGQENIERDNITHFKILEYVTGNKAAMITTEQNYFSTVINKYINYNKQTFARIKDITTISKRRIRTINKYDPIGKIKASASTLDTIDSSVEELFIGK